VPRNDGGFFALGALPLLMVIAGSVVALVAVCVDTVLRTRRESAAIADALAAAQTDLSTAIPHPTARELARIADGLRMMTAHLSYARERELALERRLSHERRLASLGRVAAGVAHEIRNPLAGMKLRLDAMARRKLDERSAHDVKRSLSEVARLDAVVSSLLSVSRKDPALLADVDLAALVDERLAALEPLASSRAVRVVRHGAAHAYVDAAGMARVIDNLVRNAIEASPEGAEVRVHLEVLDSRLAVRVTDVGPGVPPEREGELFEPFFTSKPDGTGLGLSLSRAVAEAHAGTLTYARTNGTTHFIVRLPLNEHSEAQP
jgi:signal transduction histidine kinase